MSRLFNYFFKMIILVLVINGCDACYLSNRTALLHDSWYEYNKRGEESLKKQQYDIAEKNYLRAREEYKKENVSGGGFHDSFSKIYSAQGKFGDAIEAQKKGFASRRGQWEIHFDFFYYCFLMENCLAQGTYEDAQKAVDWLIENADNGVKDAQAGLAQIKGEIRNSDQVDLYNAKGRKYTIAYLAIGEYFIQIGEYDEAIRYHKDVVDYAIQGRTLGKNIAIAKNGLGKAYYYSGNDEKAAKLFGDAAGLNQGAVVGFPKDLAYSLTMLGRIAEHRGENEKALKYYQDARGSLHMYRTLVYKTEEADVLNQVGRLQLRQLKPGEARKAYGEAIGLRGETGTQTHPNCADAVKGLADVAAFEGNLTSATAHAERALKTLDTALVPTHPRIAPTLIALASLYPISAPNSPSKEPRRNPVIHLRRTPKGFNSQAQG